MSGVLRVQSKKILPYYLCAHTRARNSSDFLAGVKEFLQELKKLRELEELSQMFYPKFS